MTNYNDMGYFNRLPLKTGVELIKKLFQKQKEKRIWDMWVNGVYNNPYMEDKDRIGWEEFSRKHMQVQHLETKEKTADEIIAAAERIKRKDINFKK